MTSSVCRPVRRDCTAAAHDGLRRKNSQAQTTPDSANQNGAPVYSTTESINPDGFQQHVAGFTSKIFAVPQLNSPYIFLAFKDMWGGGDKDMNDVVIALDVGVATVKSLLATPEPATWLTLGSFLALGLVAKRRMVTKAN